MYSLNRATLLGNTTRDPELKQIPSGQSVCSFAVATNRAWTDPQGVKQEQTEFHNVVAWGKLAEICGQYLTKGRKVYIEGRLQTRDWEGQDGVRRYRTEIVADNVILLDRPGGGGAPVSGAGSPPARGGVGGEGAPAAFKPPAPPKDDPSAKPSEEIRMEDIPF
ncbi:single-stranded DNA-binding protein [Candidatus Uhrbacteria bacterium]|nr:single-stranded DNA-binding protein [Candidatus Uhrbacteria bacterium]